MTSLIAATRSTCCLDQIKKRELQFCLKNGRSVPFLSRAEKRKAFPFRSCKKGISSGKRKGTVPFWALLLKSIISTQISTSQFSSYDSSWKRLAMCTWSWQELGSRWWWCLAFHPSVFELEFPLEPQPLKRDQLGLLGQTMLPVLEQLSNANFQLFLHTKVVHELFTKSEIITITLRSYQKFQTFVLLFIWLV